MNLYHGSNMEIIKPEIIPSNRALDFGPGFYTTSDFEQAKRWGGLTKERKNNGSAVVNEYIFEDIRADELKILRFEMANAEWLKFVSSCRREENDGSDYDLIIGPVADDRTFEVISLYFAGVYDEDEALKRLLPFKLKDQYTFKTSASLDLLKFVRRMFV